MCFFFLRVHILERWRERKIEQVVDGDKNNRAEIDRIVRNRVRKERKFDQEKWVTIALLHTRDVMS